MAEATTPTNLPLRRTELHSLHVSLGARMVPFAGYEMPVQYKAGVLKEHLHTRAAAGLFDISHMGQIEVRARSGRPADAARALETLVCADVLDLAAGRQRYALFTNDAGGILDDLMIANRGDHLLLVVNAACKDADARHLQAHLAASCEVRALDRALIALQGPKAEDVLVTLSPGCRAMRFMDVAALPVMGHEAIVSRSGYTGEDGYEISLPAGAALAVAETLARHPDVLPIGLGARDSLRLEAGLCLYGADIDAATTPVEAALEWAIPRARREGGNRPGGFPGADRLFDQLAKGATRRRVGLRPEGRAPVRGGAALFATETDATPMGAITSGGFGPSLDAPVVMGYVPTSLAAPGTRVFCDLRGKKVPATVVPLPFLPARYKR